MKKYIGIILTLGILCLNGLWAEWTWTNKTTADGLGDNYCTSVYVSGNTLYVVTNIGLSISTDGGTTWINKTNAHGLSSSSCDVSAIGSTVYVATYVGLSISTDGGNTWTTKTTTNGLGSNDCRGVYVSGNTVYVATYVGLSISTDGGNTWINKTTAHGLGSNNCWGVYATGSTVYVATNDGGLSISTDGGTTWINKTTAHGLGSNHCWGVYATGSTVYVATNDGGLSISTDGGTTWTNKTTTDGLGSSTCRDVYAIGRTVYVATNGGLSISNDGGMTWTNKTTTDGLGENFCFGVYATGSTVYVATFGGGLSVAQTDIPATPASSLTRKIVRLAPKIQLINQDDLGNPISIFEIDETSLNIGTIPDSTFDDIGLTRNLQGPQLVVPETNPIAATINAAGGAISAKAIFYDVNNAAIFMNGTQITGTDGTVFAGYENYVKNVSYNAATRTLTFDVTHFTEYGVKALTGLTFTGTAGNAQILAPGSNLALRVLGVTINGAVTQNIITPVERVHGLAYETVVAALSQNVGVYAPVIPGQDYGFAFEYINRGNATDVVQLAHTMTNANFATSITANAQSITPWQAVYFDLKFNASNATQALERSTLNVTVSLDQSGYVAGEDHRVQYTPFFGAVSSTFNDEGIYGGLGGFSYQFILEAQGYNLKVITRNATISYPADYTGVTGNIVPGARVTYEIVLQNLSNTIANNIVMGDKVPNNCHVLVTDPTCTPNVDGAMAWTWLGATENANTAEAVKYDLTIPPLGVVTAAYTVTVD